MVVEMMSRPFHFYRLLTGIISFAFLYAQAFAEVRDPETYFFNESFGNFAEELENARDNDKKGVLIMFQQEDCPYCHRMRTTILNQAAVQDYYRQHFLIFHVDIEGDLEITDFNAEQTIEKDFAFKQNRVRATPVFAFFDLDGNRVARYTGAATDAEEIMLLGKYVVDEIYKSMSFNRYKREQQEQS
jgi:thioredoxin-related protein